MRRFRSFKPAYFPPFPCRRVTTVGMADPTHGHHCCDTWLSALALTHLAEGWSKDPPDRALARRVRLGGPVAYAVFLCQSGARAVQSTCMIPPCHRWCRPCDPTSGHGQKTRRTDEPPVSSRPKGCVRAAGGQLSSRPRGCVRACASAAGARAEGASAHQKEAHTPRRAAWLTRHTRQAWVS